MPSDAKTFPDPVRDIDAGQSAGEQSVVLAGGCFWCTEAVFKELDGVLAVTSGYAGGTAATANYEAVCSGRTDHAEALRVRFDPQRISYGQILKVFFAVAHDPTQLDRQGNDHGRQYRSAVFYTDDAQREAAAAYIRQLDEAQIFPKPIVTTLEPLDEFFVAEDYHQDYAACNPRQPYIVYTTAPKVAKLREQYGDRLKGATKSS